MKLLNIVILAENYQELVGWYKNVLSLDTLLEEKGEYHYTELGFEKKVILGITPASEVKHTPAVPRNNSSLLQIEVSDIEALFNDIRTNKGKILFGPSTEVKYGFRYGGFADIEGNEVWVVEETIK